jgi:hypothetical protein
MTPTTPPTAGNFGPVNTKRVSTRALRFASLDQALAEAEALAAGDAQGRVRAMGNWSLGQALGHVAWWINAGFDGGYPPPAWIVRVLGRLMKNAVLNKPPVKGMRIPGVAGGTYGTDALSTAEGLARLRAAIARLKSAPPARPNPVFGAMTHEEWTALHLRHAEGHLGFFEVTAA